MTQLIAAICVIISGLLLAWSIAATFLAIRYYRAFMVCVEGLEAVREVFAVAQRARQQSTALSNTNEVKNWVN